MGRLPRQSGRRGSGDPVAWCDQALCHAQRRRLYRPSRTHYGGCPGRVLRRRRANGLREVDHPGPDRRAGAAQRRRGHRHGPAGARHPRRYRVRLSDRRHLSLEDRAGERGRRPPLPRRARARRPRPGPRLDRPGGARRVRRPLPPPALGRHAQARRAGAEPDQRSAHPADGRALLRPRRADTHADGKRAAIALGLDVSVRRLRHP